MLNFLYEQLAKLFSVHLGQFVPDFLQLQCQAAGALANVRSIEREILQVGAGVLRTLSFDLAASLAIDHGAVVIKQF